MCCRLVLLPLLLVFLLASSTVRAEEVLLLVDPIPADGLVVAQVDLTAAVKTAKIDGGPAKAIQALTTDGQAIPVQLVPDVDFDPKERIAGILALRLPKGATAGCGCSSRPPCPRRQALGRPGFYVAVHLATRPEEGRWVSLAGEVYGHGKAFDGLRWNDRLHHRELGGYLLAADRKAKVERISQGPLCTAIRLWARYRQPDGRQPDSEPAAIYDWIYWADRPLVSFARR